MREIARQTERHRKREGREIERERVFLGFMRRRVYGLGFWALGLGVRVQGLGFKVFGPGRKVFS